MDQTRYQHTQQQMSSGLTRYRSAPSSYFETVLNSTDTGGGGYARDDFDQLINARNSSSDMQQAFGRFMASIDSQDVVHQNQQNDSSNSLNVKQESVAFEPPPQQKLQRSGGNYGQMSYSGQTEQSHTATATTTTSAMDNSYGLMNSANLSSTKMNTGVANSNLTRYNTSPAGFFTQFDSGNEYGATRGASSSGAMASISEIGEESVKAETQKNDEIPMPFWDDSDLLSDYFLNVPEEKPFSNSDVQKSEDNQTRPPAGLLSHHLSLPKIPAQLSAIMQDSVPCKVRAKRGCATHPRSIAERVRRTRISERMRKLQDLVPNMDKQTNTSDMLDLAVDYIKDLEAQVKVLSENRAKCTCSSSK